MIFFCLGRKFTTVVIYVNKNDNQSLEVGATKRKLKSSHEISKHVYWKFSQDSSTERTRF